MHSTGGTFEHCDLALATTIKMVLNEDGTMTRRGNQVFWSYTRTEPLDKVINDFRSKRCRVEPVAFSRSIRIMRSKVYSMIDYNPPLRSTGKNAA